MPIDDDDIRWLMSLAEAENLAEIEVRDGDSEVLLRHRDIVSVAAVAGLSAGLPGEGVIESLEPELPENVLPITAPMTGVFYHAASPESPPYVTVGQTVEPGDTVGLIETMKLFNDVTSTIGGTVYDILARNEEQVEAGQTLILIQT